MNAAALFTFLKANQTITAKIGGKDAPRIYWRIKPQDELRSCLVLAIATEIPGQSLSGPDGTEAADLVITCFAPTYADARELAGIVSTELDNQTIGDADYTVEDRRDLPIVPAAGQEKPLVHGVLLSVTVEH